MQMTGCPANSFLPQDFHILFSYRVDDNASEVCFGSLLTARRLS